MKLDNGQTILFTGDSITDCGRTHPIGERGGLGDGYVAEVDSMLSAWYPARVIRVLNMGISGNRIIDLERRWQSGTLDYKPDWLAIMIGVNDAWRQFDSISNPDQVDIQRYEVTYRKLLEQTRPGLSGLVLMTPFFLETNRSDPMRARVDEYSSVTERMANAYDAVFANVQAEFDRYLEHRPTQSLCGGEC